MTLDLPRFLDRLHQPAYTGENRCLPCTSVNLAIAGVLVITVRRIVSQRGAAIVGGGSLLLIYLRGYLVPGTPTFTKRYFPEWLLKPFGKHNDHRELEGDEIDVDTWLFNTGLLVECDTTNDLCLTDEFIQAWQEQIETVRGGETDQAAVGAVFDVDGSQLSFHDLETGFAATIEDTLVGQWESETAYLADVAAANLLKERYEGWSRIPLQHQSQVLQGLRLFLDTCPSCDGRVSLDEETVESCCRSMDVAAVTCNNCGDRVFEIEYGGAAA